VSPTAPKAWDASGATSSTGARERLSAPSILGVDHGEDHSDRDAPEVGDPSLR
jgi:hypothetical protein